MELFLHTLTRIRIISGDLDFECTPDHFQAIEPDYPGLPALTQAPAVCRYWTPEWSYIEDANGVKLTNTVDCAAYCDNVAAYIGAQAVLYIHHDYAQQAGTVIFQADGVPLLTNTGADVLRITTTIRASADPESAVVEQINQSFPIRVCYKDGREAFIRLIAPIAPGVFQIDLDFAGEMPVRHQLFDADFQTVELEGVTYSFQQVAPLIIDVYKA